MITIKDLSIRQGVFSLSNINFSIDKGEYVVLMGKTGCGKTTILEAICGLRKISNGKIFIDDKNITTWPPGDRGIGYVPQDGALFNQLSVKDNIGFALKIRKWPKADIEARINHLSKLLSIEPLLDRMPIDLSGGEKQRVALARALSYNPTVLCLDEPLSALDEETKENLYQLFESIKQSIKISILHISHSSLEAERLGDRILLLEDGIMRTIK